MRVDRSNGHAQQHDEGASAFGPEEFLDFVRFCYRRRRVGWPDLYDEMCLVAARGAYRGLGYAELAECGITFSLADLPQLAQLTQRVLLEEHASPEPGRSEMGAALRLSAARANS